MFAYYLEGPAYQPWCTHLRNAWKEKENKLMNKGEGPVLLAAAGAIGRPQHGFWLVARQKWSIL